MMLKVWSIFTQRRALWENSALPVILLQTHVMLLNIDCVQPYPIIHIHDTTQTPIILCCDDMAVSDSVMKSENIKRGVYIQVHSFYDWQGPRGHWMLLVIYVMINWLNIFHFLLGKFASGVTCMLTASRLSGMWWSRLLIYFTSIPPLFPFSGTSGTSASTSVVVREQVVGVIEQNFEPATVKPQSNRVEKFSPRRFYSQEEQGGARWI